MKGGVWKGHGGTVIISNASSPLADQLPFGGFDLFGFGSLKLSDLADSQLHQLVFGFQPIVQVMPRLAAMLKKYFMGSATDLFLGGTIEVHTPFLRLSCWAHGEFAHPAWFPLIGLFNISPIREETDCFRKYFRPPVPAPSIAPQLHHLSQ